jgi:hypothetical protein
MSFGLENSGGYSTAKSLKLWAMAISNFEMDNTANMVLESELSDQLNRKHIEQILHEILQDKISKKDTDTALYRQLFNGNQLL